MPENWKPVSDFPGYDVSDGGNVRRSPNAEAAQGSTPGAVLSPAPNKKGYMIVTLRKNGKTISKYVHDLVGRHFVKGFKSGTTVNHKDRNRGNNGFKNLEFMSREDNSGHGRISKVKILAIRKLTREGMRPSRIAYLLRIRTGVVSAVLREIGK